MIIDRLLIANWRISLAIILNRDSKFMLNFWQTFFRKLNVSLLISTVYHFQTNEQSERSNQTVKIAIKFLIANEFDIFTILFSIQTQFNNSFNAITKLTFNQVIYDFKIKETILFINEQSSEELSLESARLKYKIEIVEAISFANAQMKIRYNTKHVFLLFKSNEKAFLKLHKRYKTLNQKNRKLSN